jgi:hypothetical protein
MTYEAAETAYFAALEEFKTAYRAFQIVADGFLAGSVADADYFAAKALVVPFQAAVDAAEVDFQNADEPIVAEVAET